MTDRSAASFPGEIGRIYPRVGVPDRWITTYRGIRVVRPELCIYQLCGHVPLLKAERALDTALSMGLVTVRSMRACLAELRRRGRNGTSVLHALLEARPLDYAAPATGLEARFIEVVGGDWRRQVNSGGELWAGRVDFRHRVYPVIIEVQSERYHGALSFRRDDEERKAKLEAAGFVVDEVWDRQLWHSPHEARAVVAAALQRVLKAAS
jgi:very-short-patch-repair endonuclease